MALLLRAITPLPERVVELDQLVRVDVRDLSAWLSELHDANVRFGREDLLEHHRLVDEIFAQVEACLPARFPSWFDEAQLRTRHAELSAKLERVRGCCEFAVTGTWLTPADETRDDTKISSGRAYLAQRQRIYAASDKRLERAKDLAEELERRVRDDLIDLRRKLCPSPNVALSLALLVERTHVEEVRSRIGQTAEDVRILINGPWPPYTFAGVGPEQGDG